jgi:hypothetical protein
MNAPSNSSNTGKWARVAVNAGLPWDLVLYCPTNAEGYQWARRASKASASKQPVVRYRLRGRRFPHAGSTRQPAWYGS